MSLPPGDLELERLLRPITPDACCGVSLRYEGTFDQVRKARREDDASLPPGVWQKPLKVSDYNAVVRLCAEALEHRTKDLQVAAWLADAWAQMAGFAGLVQGLKLLTGLVERYWDSLHPSLAEDGSEARVQILAWLDEALTKRLSAVNLGGEQQPFTLADWEHSGRQSVAPDRAEEPSREGLLARVTLIGGASWSALHRDGRAVAAACEAFETAMVGRLEEPVSLRRLKANLATFLSLAEDVLAALRHGERDIGSSDIANEERHNPAASSGAQESLGAASGMGGRLSGRAEAYRRLTEAADYLLRTEPHSPVPYLVKRAIGWGNMSLAELLQEFISSSDDLVTTHRLLGMRQRDE